MRDEVQSIDATTKEEVVLELCYASDGTLLMALNRISR